MVIVFPETILTNAGSLRRMTEVVTRCGLLRENEEVLLDFEGVRDLDENLCAALGVFVSRWKRENRRVSIKLNAMPVLSTFRCNHFLDELQLPYSWCNCLPDLAPDRNIVEADDDSQVYPLPYRHFNRTDADSQAEYVKGLLNEEWWPRMTLAVRDALISDGRLSVLSDSGFWELSSGKEETEDFCCAFPGTVVTIVVNTDDSKSYCLVSESE